MHTRAGELLLVALVATVLIGVIAAPVVRSPSTRIFGAPIVGAHHDPLTMMQVWAAPLVARASLQPVTDVPGHWLATRVGPVAAYNWMVLLTFPLAAITAFALARHLAIPRGGAALAALAFAFSPFHLAHAAYHPHIAQVQWLPLYVLALWQALARGTPLALLGLAAATVGVVLSNLYGGFIVATLTPVLLVRGWATFRLVRVLALFGVMAVVGLAFVTWVAPSLWGSRAAAAVSIGEIEAYSARVMAYVMPPVAHPWLGEPTMRMWRDAGVSTALLEQQISLGWGIVALAGVAVWAWVRQRREIPSSSEIRAVPVLLLVAVVAGVLSAAPDVVMASGLYQLAPMFRAYARFGVVVQLMAVLLAGMGLARLLQQATGRARALAIGLVVLVVCEYAVAPAAMSREIWPSAAHRWVHDSPAGVRVLECVPFSDRAAAESWLTGGRIQQLGGGFADCGEPHLAAKLAGVGFTHLLVRTGTHDAPMYQDGATPPGLVLVQRDAAASLWQVVAPVPAIYVDSMTGWWPREQDAGRSWRWMGAEGSWRLMNPGPTAIHATVRVELAAFDHTCTIEIRLDDAVVGAVVVHPERQVHVIGPVRVQPGYHHVLTFHAIAPPTMPSAIGAGDDSRPLTIAIGAWYWTTVPQVP